MEITNIFRERVEVTDLNAAITQVNNDLGFARDALKDTKQVHCKYIERNGESYTLVSYHSHLLNELLKLLPPLQYPEWLLVCGFPTCYGYCDKRKEERGDYKSILRLFYNPLRIEIKTSNMKAYPEVLELAKEQLKRLQARVNEPLVVTASGQTTGLTLSTGPDIVIVKY